MQKSITKSSAQTQQLGQDLAKKILKKDPEKTAVVLCLTGDLGAGKTTFLQGFAKGLGIKEVVNSPTFVIMKKFRLRNDEFAYFYHIDLYRLHDSKEILHLGLKEIILNPKNIIAIEWPEKISEMLPKNSINITFSHDTDTQRSLSITENGL